MSIDSTLAMKCRECHLFVEENDDWYNDNTLARYLHLHRGDDADEALDMHHEAQPSEFVASFATWKAFGPGFMRNRFVDSDAAGDNEPAPDAVGDLLVAINMLANIKTSGVGSPFEVVEYLTELLDITGVLLNTDHDGTISELDDIVRAAETVVIAAQNNKPIDAPVTNLIKLALPVAA